MKVTFAGECLLDLSRYDLYKTYKDLFMWDKDRKEKVEWGIGGVDLRKIRSATSPAPTDSGDATAVAEAKAIKAAYGTKYVIPLDFEVLSTHGVFYPRILGAEMQFEVTLADTTNILEGKDTAISGSVDPYKMTNLELQYETIHSETLARSAMAEYSAGKAFLYDHVTLYKTSHLMDKTTELITQTINVPRRSLSGLLVLFVKPFESGKRDSEAFANPNITNVNVNVNGVPNKVYSQGIKAGDIYKEAVRRYGDFISPEKFFKDKYALWVDMRTSEDNDIHGQGLKLVSTQDGITLEIKRTLKATGSDDKINYYIFVVGDAQMSVEGNQLKSIAY